VGRVIRQRSIVVLMPVYRDWDSASIVCRELDDILSRHPEFAVRVLLVDDGSPDGIEDWQPFENRALGDISVLHLRTNLGHQRAICAGLCHIHDAMACDFVLVMDADGEDRPADAVRLMELSLSRSSPALFAERRRRFAGTMFRLGYGAFRLAHRVLTGVSVRVGNFSILRFSALTRLVIMPELWNHYAGAVFKSRLRFESVPMDRGDRVAGRPQMNITSLVTHGLAGIATFQETVATRVLIFNALGLVLLLAAIAVAVAIRMFTHLAIPGWATYTTGFFVVCALQLLVLSFNLAFSLIANRNRMLFLPVRDYATFVDKIVTLSQPVTTGAAVWGGD
jgi:hypothetical protein